MGACQFVSTAYGKTASEAYDKAVEDAYYEYGHDAYNGTISTTNGFKLLGKRKTYAEAAKMSEILDWDEAGIDKWENCGCIEIEENDGHHEGQKLYYFFGWGAC